MEKIYNPKTIEESIYNFWDTGNYFSSHNGNVSQENYCIMMPPPNITGQLHLGHAFQHTIMDILIRYNRMMGKNTLWQTGTDHAGIATQILMENKIYNDTGKTKDNYTRDEFIEKIWEWKKELEISIIYQMKRLGNSIDWKRKRFTMDAEMSYAVREAFIKMYKKNLIYKGKKLVNWDTKLQTAISDLEVTNKQMHGHMWYIYYPLDHDNYYYQRYINNHSSKKENIKHLIIATTRPETIFGDTAIAVHPEDTRYNKLIGLYVTIPIINRRIPIIADDNVDMLKGTGCVKITPAHDFNDYIIGKKHKLPMINIMSLTGKILEHPEFFYDHHGDIQKKTSCSIPKKFHNLNINDARIKIVAEFNKLKLLHKIEPCHNMMIPCNNRTGTIIEPILTDQWYIRTKNLAKQAIDAVENNLINFVPEQYKNMYFSWMHNVQDWCISRQIWWGHKIPVWYGDNNQIYVGHCEQDIRIKNKLNDSIHLNRDNDVLDTWFSSSLWTFASLGWPINTDLLHTFHPTNIIISGFDIIFFWIARMIMLTMNLIKNHKGIAQIPFKTVYITGLIRDEFGKKMSKSKGNTIDPLDIIDGISIKNLLKKRTTNVLQPQLIQEITKCTKKQFPNGIKPYGADSLRFTLMALSSSGRDIHWDMKRLAGYHNFCNKLWNASHYVLTHTKNKNCGFSGEKKTFSLADRWIMTKFHQTIQQFHKQLEIYRFDKIASILHEFIWHQFCDWYIEFTKPILHNGSKSELCGTRYTLITLLELILKLAHPVIPFITEKIWQKTKIITGNSEKTITLQPFPKYDVSAIDKESIIDFEWIQHIISTIRTVRMQMNITHKAALQIAFQHASSKIIKRITNNYNILCKLAHLKNIDINPTYQNHSQHVNISVDTTKLLVYIPHTFNKKIKLNQLHKELELINNKITVIQTLLKNDNFLKQAPSTIILNKKTLLNNYKKTKKQLYEQLLTIQKTS
ncbi:valine--tRNA ligase [Candidatus Blochmannia ocreatus (nom. nud.)]|uniref:Valine--tRNA ligase n=1 Tax=Candidatus Blochmannia ocreatus (nom. nud.) TaxID=251538 RepID=A0ABY4T041_9ENTR|nr:valine--tRNA ligase [Candidatus Blochmannia ocreatus]URJ25444.1 valine--tRNA ligase [Candidatus Blochmannia ocreatus]